MIGPDELRAMKHSALLVNVARGPLVQTDALVVEALASGVIGGAALDVTDPEPLSGDHPLLEMDNCLVVPHVGKLIGQNEDRDGRAGGVEPKGGVGGPRYAV